MSTETMHNEILFTETQKFKRWLTWLVLLGINGLFLFGVYKQVILGQQFGDKPMNDTGLLIVTVFTIVITLLFLNSRLDTIIKADGIHVRFFPFHLKFRVYSWDKLAKSYIRTYSPLQDYGGWGLRFGFFGKGIAYIVSGNRGLQLEFTNGKKLLIGTNKPNDLEDALNKIGQLKQ